MGIQQAANSTANTSSTSLQILGDRGGSGLKRTSFVITNTSAAAIVTIAKGNNPAVQKVGYVLQPTGNIVESNSEGFECYQGSIQAVSDVAGSIAIVETFE
jgi:hypothetical protein